MKALQRTLLAIALTLPATALLAADPPEVDAHADHATAAIPTEAAPMTSMRERMQQIRQTQDPEKRKELMEAQMKDMETLMQRPMASCPKAEGMSGKCGGKAMMGGKCGGKPMSSGKCGKSDDMLPRRMEMMEKRMDMMQMMMQKQMGQGGMTGK